ncbi:molybdopterin molybdotransferase MoeA [Rhizobium mayense]|uniref:Molybdopterin molybdenumtransferase n=1 Tax=Rhizobium mayense TaxID=1312184 RepID=A0ABT7K2T3_9HYPH|nr:gephyrin-like molybdotransferase Glp [Rhizobium mayense]MDL2402497.1 molybdopterin molybdotransferase MoeA [Rhizobium mayense]
MPALLPDCYHFERVMVSFEAARLAAMALATPLDLRDDVPLAHARGRILAAPIEAPRSLPPFDQAAMDGYAVHIAGKGGVPSVLPVTGRTIAGDPPGVLAPGTAHRIMTGAALPSGADTVVMQEHVTRRGDLVQLGLDLKPGAHIRRAGEDVTQGSVVLDRGRIIGWKEIALLGALGIDTVAVVRPLRITVLTTGSELHAAGTPLPPGAIYDSNGPMLAALLAGPNIDVVSLTFSDDPAAITRALQEIKETADIVITSAGMSVGEGDHVRDAVLRAGGELDVVKVAMKPGKPLAFGKLGNACFVGLPGNPQAAAFAALAFVRPMTRVLLGQAPVDRMTAEMTFTFTHKPDRTDLLPVRLSVERGRLIAHRCGPDGSHRIMTMACADAIVIVPNAQTAVEAGAVLEVLPFDQSHSDA